jgi:hypothetical protein
MEMRSNTRQGMKSLLIPILGILAMSCQHVNPSLRIQEIQILPFKGERVDDEVYNKLIAAGDTAVDCLIERITDTTRMADPRKAPSVGTYRVGDTALFVLCDITGVKLTDMLPEEVVSNFEDVGIYSHFRYVENYENRLRIQEAWRAYGSGHKPDIEYDE